MPAVLLRHCLLPIVSTAAVLLVPGAVSPTFADPIRVTGTVFVDSAGGDFPDVPLPIDELIYVLGGPGLPEARGEVLETSAAHGTRGGLVVSTARVPVPLVAGARFDLSTHARFSLGQAIESTWPDSGRVYDIAGDFAFTAGTAVLQAGDAGLLLGSAPFSFSGTLRGSEKGTGALLFEHQLRGGGRATVHLFQQNPSFFDYRYELDAVPEPSTLLLFASGLGALRLARRRTRRADEATSLPVKEAGSVSRSARTRKYD